MIDHKVPRHMRGRLPLLVIDGVVAVIWWKPMTAISEQFTVGEGAQRVVYFALKSDLELG